MMKLLKIILMFILYKKSLLWDLLKFWMNLSQKQKTNHTLFYWMRRINNLINRIQIMLIIWKKEFRTILLKVFNDFLFKILFNIKKLFYRL
jgi:hypothetical protein